MATPKAVNGAAIDLGDLLGVERQSVICGGETFEVRAPGELSCLEVMQAKHLGARLGSNTLIVQTADDPAELETAAAAIETDTDAVLDLVAVGTAVKALPYLAKDAVIEVFFQKLNAVNQRIGRPAAPKSGASAG